MYTLLIPSKIVESSNLLREAEIVRNIFRLVRKLNTKFIEYLTDVFLE